MGGETVMLPQKEQVREIIETVAARAGVPVSLVLGKTRHLAAVYLRIEIAKQLSALGFSTPQIGKWLNKDHTSVLYYLGRGQKKVNPPRWRAPRIRHLNCQCHPWSRPDVPRRKPLKAYLIPYAGADRHYVWKERRREDSQPNQAAETHHLGGG